MYGIENSEKERLRSMLQYERELWDKNIHYIAGVDEAGRGPLAGPVVAAAVIFPKNIYIPGVNDSKKLTARRRTELFYQIEEKAIAVETGIVHEKEIDRINILQATHKAMRMAIGRLEIRPAYLLIDGRPLPEKIIPQTAITGGDSVCFSIAAASIVAKVTRDRMMVEYDEMFPQYGFAKHKGYGTRKHFEAIQKFGLCEIHRRSFKITGWRKND